MAELAHRTGVAALVGVPVALASIRSRTSAILVALVTLIISEAVAPVIVSVDALGGPLGLLLDSKPQPSWLDMHGDQVFFARTLLVMNMVLIGLYAWFRRSRYGYWATALRDAPGAAQAVGVPVRRMQILLFIVSGAIVAPAGAVYAQFNLNVTVDMFLGTAALFQVVTVALVGGSAQPWGALVGAIAVVWLTEQATNLSGGRPGVSSLTFAVLFVIMALAMPARSVAARSHTLHWMSNIYTFPRSVPPARLADPWSRGWSTGGQRWSG